MVYFIVEHESRGCYVDSYWGEGPHGQVEKHRFSWSVTRTDRKIHRFVREQDADRVLLTVRNSYLLRVDPRARGEGYIKRISYTPRRKTTA